MNRVADIVLPHKDINKVREAFGEDQQSKDLLRQVCRHFQECFAMEDNEEAALARLLSLLASVDQWKNSPGLLRNNIFKVANSLKMDLPSAMF